MLDLDLSPEVDELLEVMARKAGQTKSEFAVAAILEKLEDMEDYAIALERLRTLGKTLSWEEVTAELDRLDQADEAAA
ncbi:MAG: DUF6290 family protein [Devosia sp.]|nr:DUF6290 family protein [Devosia sp.]